MLAIHGWDFLFYLGFPRKKIYMSNYAKNKCPKWLTKYMLLEITPLNELYIF